MTLITRASKNETPKGTTKRAKKYTKKSGRISEKSKQNFLVITFFGVATPVYSIDSLRCLKKKYKFGSLGSPFQMGL